MFVCMYNVCMFVYLYVFGHMQSGVCMYMFVCICLYVCIFVCICNIHIGATFSDKVYVCIFVCICLYVCIMSVYLYVYIHWRTHCGGGACDGGGVTNSGGLSLRHSSTGCCKSRRFVCSLTHSSTSRPTAHWQKGETRHMKAISYNR